MKRLIFILLATSITANAWMTVRTWRRDAARVPPTTPPPRTLNPVPAPIPVLVDPSRDLRVWRDELRQSGVDESTLRAIIEGQLRQRYRAEMSARQTAQLQSTWWQSDMRKAATEDTQLLKDLVQLPLRELLGRNPLDLQDAEKRFDFLPPAKRRMLAEIELDYAEMGGAGRASLSSTTLQSDIQRQDLLALERRNDVMAALTREERAEFEVRFEGSAGLLSGRLAVMNGTEQEFRALRPLLDELRQQERALPGGEGFSAAYADLNQKAVDRIAAVIGRDRALDFLWSGPGLYPELVRFAQDRGLPASTASCLLQLAAETGVRASAIHHDVAIPADEKVAALQALQVNVGNDFDQLVPAPLRLQLPPMAVEWFRMLGEGRYMGLSPSLTSTGSGTTAPTSIATRVMGRAWSMPPQPGPVLAR